jgi:hypothetical protein
MNEDTGGRKGETLPGAAAGKEKGGHARRLTEAYRLDVGLDVLNCIVNRKTCRNAPSGRVDVEIYISLRVLRLKEKELSDHEIGSHVENFPVEKDDPVFQETGIDIIGTFPRARVLHDYGNKSIHLLIHQITPFKLLIF